MYFTTLKTNSNAIYSFLDIYWVLKSTLNSLLNSGVNSGIRYQGDPGEKTRGSNGGGDSTSSVCSQDLRNVCGVPFKYAGV